MGNLPKQTQLSSILSSANASCLAHPMKALKALGAVTFMKTCSIPLQCHVIFWNLFCMCSAVPGLIASTAVYIYVLEHTA